MEEPITKSKQIHFPSDSTAALDTGTISWATQNKQVLKEKVRPKVFNSRTLQALTASQFQNPNYFKHLQRCCHVTGESVKSTCE